MEGVREGKKKEDMNGNGEHAVKRATEQSVQSICWLYSVYLNAVKLSLFVCCATAGCNLGSECGFYIDRQKL